MSISQVGSNILGENNGDRFGSSVSISKNGKVVAVSSPFNNDMGINSGHIKLFEYNIFNNEWNQLGQTISGINIGNRFGWSVSLSEDGYIVAGSAPFTNDYTIIYKYNSHKNIWEQFGQTINSEVTGDQPRSVSLSVDGLKIAIGSSRNDGGGNIQFNSGHTRIFKYNFSNNMWIQIGQDIDGEMAGDESGRTVSLSGDGYKVAIGSSKNDGNGQNSGHARIFEYNSLNNMWEQLGQNINGKSAGDESALFISIASNALIVSIGSPVTNTGYTSMYKYNYVSNKWEQLGQDIFGENTGDFFGGSVFLSADGLRVAIGSSSFNNSTGRTTIYDYFNNTWTQYGEDINGDSMENKFGRSVSLSADGLRVIIGANEIVSGLPGYAKVYTLGLSKEKEIKEINKYWTTILNGFC